MLSIRPYEAADADACRALWVELTVAHRELYDAPSLGGADPGARFDDHLAAAGADRLRVAELGGALVGLAGTIEQGRSAELEPVVVTAALRGRGIGRALAEAAIDDARQRGATSVFVRPVGRNTAAIRFFHGLGFDVLTRVELVADLSAGEPRSPGETIAGRPFRV